MANRSFFNNSETGILAIDGFVGRKVHIEEIKVMSKIYSFRYQVIVNELKWLPPNTEEQDKDEYDPGAHHFAVFDSKKQIVGYVRIIRGNSIVDFMLGNEFKDVMPYDSFEIMEYLRHHRNQCAEISRLIVHPQYRTSVVEEILYKLMVHWCWQRKFFYWFITISKEFYGYFGHKRFFALKKWAEGNIQNGDVKCVTATLDLKETRQNLIQKDSEAAHFLFETTFNDST